MDKSLSQFEIESTPKSGSDSEQNSDKSETIEIVNIGDVEQQSTNGNSVENEEDFDKNLPETVTILRHEATGAKVYLIGTAHFSHESKQDVINVIRNVAPNVVVLELCASRTHILSLDEETILEEAKNINFEKIVSHIKTSGLYNGTMYLLLLNMSAKLTKQLGMAPGGEFRAAYKEAKEISNCEVLLGDRPLNITFQRALARLTWWQTLKLVWHLATNQDSVSLEDVEKCKKRDMLEQLLAELAGEYPAFKDVFLTERDIFLTNSLQTAALYRHKKARTDDGGDRGPLKIVGVVGIGHVPGITRLWPVEQKALIPEILEVPPPSVTSKVVKFTFRIGLLTFGGYLIYRYVPVPKMLRENAQSAIHKVVMSVKESATFKYTVP